MAEVYRASEQRAHPCRPGLTHLALHLIQNVLSNSFLIEYHARIACGREQDRCFPTRETSGQPRWVRQ